MSDEPEKDSFGNPLRWGLAVGGGMLFAFFLVWLAAPRKTGLEGLAQIFGDIAGTAISSLALMLLVIAAIQQQQALRIQREDLKLTRQELKDTREELQRTADAQQRQVDIAQMAARLNATASLLDSATQEMGMYGVADPDRQDALMKVRHYHEQLQTQRDELADTVYGGSHRTVAVYRSMNGVIGAAVDDEASRL